MKTTLDIPDDLYRRVKAKSALEGRPVGEVTVALYESWLREEVREESASATADRWLDEFLSIGREAMERAPTGPTAREILDAGRDRLEHKAS